MLSPYPRAALFGDTGSAGETISSVYGAQRIQHLQRVTSLYPVQITSQNIEARLSYLHEVEVIFATWGMLCLTEEQLDRLPSLRAVFYAAGSVKHFAPPMLERGITVVSGGPANAVPVAEFALGQILLANKGYFRNVRDYLMAPNYDSAFRGRGNYGVTVSILGAGQIGRRLIELLRPLHLHIVVFDPFLSSEAAASLGIEKIESLEEAFVRGDIVSNHLADVPETAGILTGSLFGSMKKNATFINTGRGRTVKGDEMVQVLSVRPDLTALLDVTDPEPLPLHHPLRSLPNVHISGHIAGSIGNEVGRLADLVLEEFENWRTGRPLRHEVSIASLQISG